MNSHIKTWHLEDDSPSYLLAEMAAYCMLQKQAEDVRVLDLRGRSDVCDFFVIATGQADVQVRAIAGALREGLAAQGHELLSVEGLPEARWALLDYVDVVVHVFLPETRNYYLLERLWGDAPQAVLDFEHFRHSLVRQRQPGLPSSSSSSGAIRDACESETS